MDEGEDKSATNHDDTLTEEISLLTVPNIVPSISLIPNRISSLILQYD